MKGNCLHVKLKEMKWVNIYPFSLSLILSLTLSLLFSCSLPLSITHSFSFSSSTLSLPLSLYIYMLIYFSLSPWRKRPSEVLSPALPLQHQMLFSPPTYVIKITFSTCSIIWINMRENLIGSLHQYSINTNQCMYARTSTWLGVDDCCSPKKIRRNIQDFRILFPCQLDSKTHHMAVRWFVSPWCYCCFVILSSLLSLYIWQTHTHSLLFSLSQSLLLRFSNSKIHSLSTLTSNLCPSIPQLSLPLCSLT